jgi:hypothetical protein
VPNGRLPQLLGFKLMRCKVGRRCLHHTPCTVLVLYMCVHKACVSTGHNAGIGIFTTLYLGDGITASRYISDSEPWRPSACAKATRASVS